MISLFKLKSFSFKNKSGGTGMSNWEWDPKFKGDAEVTVEKSWHDYEIGTRYIGEAASPDLIEYLQKNAHPTDKRVFFGRSDLK